MAATLSTRSGFPAGFVAEACAGRLRGEGEALRVATDTRDDVQGALFVALRGEVHDGHAHVAAALAGGARGVLVERLPEACELPSGCYAVEVEDTRAALGALARTHRRELRAPVVAITGSCGKTSTKEMAACVLGGARRVLASPKSFNNEIGVPLTLLAADENTELLLAEVGTNAAGEIAALTAIAEPDVALVTMIGRGHLEGLGSLDGVLREKSSLYLGARADGVAIVNADDPMHAAMRKAAQRSEAGPVGRRVLSFGTTHDATVRAHGLRAGREDLACTHFELEIEGRACGSVTLRRSGQHDVRNLLAAFAIGHALGIDVGEMLARVAEIPPTARRLEWKEGPRGLRILDDSYNANPESALAALSVLDRARDAGRRVAVFGDMRELGGCAQELHEELGEAAVGRVDLLVSVGELAEVSGRAFERTSGRATVRFSDVEALIPQLEALLVPGDVVLFKGSRAMRLDRAVDALVAE